MFLTTASYCLFPKDCVRTHIMKVNTDMRVLFQILWSTNEAACIECRPGEEGLRITHRCVFVSPNRAYHKGGAYQMFVELNWAVWYIWSVYVTLYNTVLYWGIQIDLYFLEILFLFTHDLDR